MNVHEQFAEDLALYALGTLQDEESVALERHLEECPACRRELEFLRGDMALMSMSISGPVPPARSRQRLLNAIRKEPRASSVSAAAQKSKWWVRASPWAAAAAFAIVALVLWSNNAQMRETVAGLRQHSAEQEAQLEKARDVVMTLTATDAMRVTLVVGKAPPQPQGKAIYVRDRSSLIFLATNLPMLPQGKAYELWLIPVVGSPVPAGVFRPDERGGASVINPPLPPRAEAKAFALTVEPEQGSLAPTSQPILIGAGK